MAKIICKKCEKELPEGSMFCCYCGNKLTRSTMRRGNGSGTAYKHGRVWVARWYDPLSGDRKSKSGFDTRREAYDYACRMANELTPQAKPLPLDEVYNKWYDYYTELGRCGESTLACYRAAYSHFDKLKRLTVDKITTQMLQSCINTTDSKSRTKQNMRTVINLVMKYAVQENMIKRNPAEDLFVKGGDTEHWEPITEEDLVKIKNAFDTEPYAKYVYVMSYLGFRPSAFLSLRRSNYHDDDGIRYFVAGIKTKAGTNRTVTIPKVIQPIIDDQMKLEGTDLLFPRIVTNKDGSIGYKLMNYEYYCKWIFKPLMSRLGIEGNKVPYSTRHTYANKIKRVEGAPRDKADLIGHANYNFTEAVYQTTNVHEKWDITAQME